jgi:hypothetical protein
MDSAMVFGSCEHMAHGEMKANRKIMASQTNDLWVKCALLDLAR